MKQVRAARFDEADELTTVAMRSKAHWGYSPQFMEACRDELRVTPERIEAESTRYFVAETDGRTVGYYAIERLTQTKWELEAMFVEPESIGKGFGRLLVEHAKETAAKLGAEELVIQGDPNAEYFYVAAGGVKVGERESQSIPGRFLPLFSIPLVR